MATARIQIKNNSVQGDTSLTVTPDSPTTTGNTLIVVVSSFFTGLTFTVTDGNGHDLAERLLLTGASGMLLVFSRDNITGSAGAITVTPSSGSQYMVATALEYSGLKSSNSFDDSEGNNDANPTYDSGAIATTAVDDLLIGVNAALNSADNYAPDGGWTEATYASDGTFHHHYVVERLAAGAAGSKSYTGTGGSNDALCGIAAFLLADAGGQPAGRRLGLAKFCRPVEIGREGVRVT